MRTYTDSEGVSWIVYVVAASGGTSPHLLPAEYKNGWLCFEASDSKRRLAPIPPDWESCPEERLNEYRASAVAVQRRIVPTSDGRNAPTAGLSAAFRDIEHFFTRRLPSSLSLALDKVAEDITQPDAPAEFRPAIPFLRDAAQAASSGDFDAAREHYQTAATHFSTAAPLIGDVQ